jgi:Tfp pilus assembly protein PilO
VTTGFRRIATISAAAVIVLVAIWYVALWHPGTKHLAAAHQAQADAQQQVDQLNTQVAHLHGLVKEAPADKARLTQLETGLPDDPSLDTALDDLNRVAVSSGVTLSSVGPSAPADQTPGTGTASASSGPQSIALSMAASGQPAQVIAFLQALTTMPRLIVVDQVGLSTGSSSAAQISARIFYAATS